MKGPQIVFRNPESLKLYRDILRTTRLFTWPSPQGGTWRDVLRANARHEFEQARLETNPETIARLLVVGRDCLNQVRDKFIDKAKQLEDQVDRTRTDRR